MQEHPDEPGEGRHDLDDALARVVLLKNLEAALHSCTEILDLMTAARERWGMARDPGLQIVCDPDPDDPSTVP